MQGYTLGQTSDSISKNVFAYNLGNDELGSKGQCAVCGSRQNGEDCHKWPCDNWYGCRDSKSFKRQIRKKRHGISVGCLNGAGSKRNYSNHNEKKTLF